MSRILALLGLAFLVVMSGSASAQVSVPKPAIAYEPVGELTGTWSGTWGGSPLTLLIVEQTEGAPYSGLYFGPWLIAGGRYPGISGVLTYARSGSPMSVRFDGWISSGQPFTVLIQARPLDGDLYMRLRAAGAGVLVGDGDSTFGWGPKGQIGLTRR
jgi:hypothetical protein